MKILAFIGALLFSTQAISSNQLKCNMGDPSLINILRGVIQEDLKKKFSDVLNTHHIDYHEETFKFKIDKNLTNATMRVTTKLGSELLLFSGAWRHHQGNSTPVGLDHIYKVRKEVVRNNEGYPLEINCVISKRANKDSVKYSIVNLTYDDFEIIRTEGLIFETYLKIDMKK